jgi:lipopolysaccharide biosynthesis glycosyltransferase
MDTSLTQAKSLSTIHLLVCTDENFAMPLAVLLRSLQETIQDIPVQVHWFALDVSDKTIDKIVLHAKTCGVIIIPYRFTRTMLPSTLYESGRITAASYLRLFLSTQLPQNLTRILYLDVDVIVLGSLNRLWQTPMDGKIVAAIPDVPYVNLSHLGSRRPIQYFNAGVILIDVAAWRASQIEATFATILEDKTLTLRFHDQDVLNLAFADSIYPLDECWNLLPSRGNRNRLRRYGWQFRFGNRKGLPDMIIHFAARHKPWHYRGKHPFKTYYRQLLEQTPWKEYSPPDATWQNRIQKFMPRILRRWCNWT